MMKEKKDDILPAGPLMIEHRLIERMISPMKKELENIRKNKKANPDFIKRLIDFLRTYADRCHHGKEEDILFERLKEKPISEEHRKIMEKLLSDHVRGRKLVAGLDEATERYRKGRKDSLSGIDESLEGLITLYPQHIDKEDNHFFLPVMEYFDKVERDEMLEQFSVFDKNLIHEKYKKIMKKMESET